MAGEGIEMDLIVLHLHPSFNIRFEYLNTIESPQKSSDFMIQDFI